MIPKGRVDAFDVSINPRTLSHHPDLAHDLPRSLHNWRMSSYQLWQEQDAVENMLRIDLFHMGLRDLRHLIRKLDHGQHLEGMLNQMEASNKSMEEDMVALWLQHQETQPRRSSLA